MPKTKTKFLLFFLIFLSSACLLFSFFTRNVKAIDPVSSLPVASETSDPVTELLGDPLTGTGADPIAAPASPMAPTPVAGAPAAAAPAAETPKAAESTTKESSINDVMGWVVGMPMKLMFSISTLIVAIAGKLLNWAFSIQTFKGIIAVDTTWKVLRDLCNMFFIVILMVSAIATILRLDKYKIGNMLKPVLIAIIAINFSKTITYVVVDFTQVLSRSFLSVAGATTTDNSVSQISEQMANNMGLTAIFRAPSFWNDDVDGWKFTGSWDMVWSTLFSAVVLLVAGVAFAVGAVMLIVRLVMIWILIAVSSAAWGFSALHGTKLAGYYNKWWDKLLHYAFFAPVYAFFIAFALLLVRGGGYAVPTGELAPGPTDFFRFSGYFLNYIITIIILYYAIGTAKGIDKHLGGKILDYAADKGQGFLKSKSDSIYKNATMARTRGALLAEHQQRVKEKEAEKQKDAGKLKDKLYAKKDTLQKNTTVAAGEVIREGVRSIPGADKFVNETGYSGRVLKKHDYKKAQEKEIEDERIETLKKFKDSPPSSAELSKGLKSKKEGERKAFAQHLGNNTDEFSNVFDDAVEQFEDAMQALGPGSYEAKKFMENVGKNRVDLVVQYKANTIPGTTYAAQMTDALRGMSAKKIMEQEDIVFNRITPGYSAPGTPGYIGSNEFTAQIISNLATPGYPTRADLLRANPTPEKIRHIP